MPRGTRAVHGHNVQGGVHGRGNTHQELYASIPETGWLPVTCWCESRIVAVTQVDVVENGITYSCGWCKPPKGVPFQSALIQWDKDMKGRIRSQHILKEFEGERARVRVHLRSKKVIKARERIAERRDRIRMMYLAGKQYKFIANELGIKYHDVVNDIIVMRQKGWI